MGVFATLAEVVKKWQKNKPNLFRFRKARRGEAIELGGDAQKTIPDWMLLL